MGFSQHAGVVIVCDGSDAAARRIARVLWNDPGTGVMRHADAGYESAIACAREQESELVMMHSGLRRNGFWTRLVALTRKEVRQLPVWSRTAQPGDRFMERYA